MGCPVQPLSAAQGQTGWGTEALQGLKGLAVSVSLLPSLPGEMEHTPSLGLFLSLLSLNWRLEGLSEMEVNPYSQNPPMLKAKVVLIMSGDCGRSQTKDFFIAEGGAQGFVHTRQVCCH